VREACRDSQFGATRCQILRLKCTKFDFHRGSALDPAEGAYSTPPDRLAVFKGTYFLGEGGGRRRGRKGKEERKGREKGREGRVDGRGRYLPDQCHTECFLRTCTWHPAAVWKSFNSANSRDDALIAVTRCGPWPDRNNQVTVKHMLRSVIEHVSVCM